ncbi:hypothetical protein I3842_01G081700 [Carya illinoinensis]|uniref:Uncharacterized protein n=1 Tax=Carya illinoinensis TaxID=32201 RepID=A0A922G162_CARIL|nr:hypothetical protein I3842_01G081700 [Carya illinoinensis]
MDLMICDFYLQKKENITPIGLKIVINSISSSSSPYIASTKLRERFQRKSHRQVNLISPIPKPKAEEEKKPQEKETQA